jgi:hypothetical protein
MMHMLSYSEHLWGYIQTPTHSLKEIGNEGDDNEGEADEGEADEGEADEGEVDDNEEEGEGD